MNLLNIKFGRDKLFALLSDYDLLIKPKEYAQVNILRIFFSYLSQDKTLLNHLEEDCSYSYSQDGMFSKKGLRLIFKFRCWWKNKIKVKNFNKKGLSSVVIP